MLLLVFLSRKYWKGLFKKIFNFHIIAEFLFGLFFISENIREKGGSSLYLFWFKKDFLILGIWVKFFYLWREGLTPFHLPMSSVFLPMSSELRAVKKIFVGEKGNFTEEGGWGKNMYFNFLTHKKTFFLSYSLYSLLI